METTEQPVEVAGMQAIAAALSTASQIDRPAYNGVFISLPGTLNLAARSLREMAEKPDTDNEDVLEAHENRCYESQPTLRAHGLEELGKHLGMLKTAIDAGDSATVRQFFEIYRFD
jgi:hypothetical protein